MIRWGFLWCRFFGHIWRYRLADLSVFSWCHRCGERWTDDLRKRARTKVSEAHK